MIDSECSAYEAYIRKRHAERAADKPTPVHMIKEGPLATEY